MVWLLGPIVGVIVAVLALQWALGAHRRERAPWLELLSRPATAAAGGGGLGAVDGVASDGGGAIPPVRAPFSGRPCLGYTLEIIVQEQFGNQTTWQRALQDGAGQVLIVGPDGERRAEVSLAGAQNTFPLALNAYTKLSSEITRETVFQGTMAQAPAAIAWFSQQLPPAVQHLLHRPSGQIIGGKRVYFNERIVVPGERVVAAGACVPGPAGVSLIATEHQPVSLGLGTLDGERARIAKLPVADELFGAILGGVIACAAVEMVVAMLSK